MVPDSFRPTIKYDYEEVYIEGEYIDSIISTLQNIREEIVEKGFDPATTYLDISYGEEYLEMTFRSSRPETEEEREARYKAYLETEKARAEIAGKLELETYLKLKKKFESMKVEDVL